jgi:hypothetical protein
MALADSPNFGSLVLLPGTAGPGHGAGTTTMTRFKVFSMHNKGTLSIALFLLSCASIAHTFLLQQPSDPFTRDSRLFRSLSPKTNSIRTLALESLLENFNNQVQKVSPVSGKISEILWKDASPQRTLDKRQISWMNQFPNTWQPAEKLVLGKDTTWHQGKETISTSGNK